MPKGIDGIPILHLETLARLVEKLPKAPGNFFSSMFPETRYDSDTLTWDVQYGSAGMTPYVAPGAPAPTVGSDGLGEGTAKVAFFKEKMFFDEEVLNNLRQPGKNNNKKQRAEQQIAKGLVKLNTRIDRRREYMCCQAKTKGGFTYTQKSGVKVNVDYGMPEEHKIILPENQKWGEGSKRNPIKNVFETKQLFSDNNGTPVTYSLCNSSVLKTLMYDSNFQEYLKKSAFGDGDLFKDPARVVGTILGIGQLGVYDDFYEVPGWLIQNVSTSDTEIFVEDATDFVKGGVLYFWKMTEPNTHEKRTITAVDINAGKITIDSAPSKLYKAKFDKVWMRRKFIEDDMFHMGASSKDGVSVSELALSPYGLAGSYGKKTDRKTEWDPDGIFVRIQDKSLPIIFDAAMQMFIKVK
jgi:hypothetical protein